MNNKINIIIVIVVLFAFAPQYQAMAIIYDFVEITGSNNPLNGVDVGYASAPALVDINGDGDLDIFVGERDGFINYFENTQNAILPIYTQRTGAQNPLNGLDVGFYSAPAFVDVDGDGDMDAFVGRETGEVVFMENTGTHTSPVFTRRWDAANPLDHIDVGDLCAPAFFDLDGDGDYDVIFGDDLYGIKISYNVGNALAPNYGSLYNYIQMPAGFNPFAPAIIDFDLDGDKDIVVGADRIEPYYRENVGVINAALFVNSQISWNHITSGLSDRKPTFGDVDHDGDMDAFVGGDDGVILFYRNMTNSKKIPRFTQPAASFNPLNGKDVGQSSSPSFVDIDADGDYDAFSGESGGSIIFYENYMLASEAGYTRNDAANPLTGGDGVYSKPTFVDIDADGDMDAFSGEFFGEIFYYENTGTAAAPAFTLRTGTANPLDSVNLSGTSAPAFADIDADGDEDALIGGSDGLIFYFRNTGSATAPALSISYSLNPFSGVDVGDLASPAFCDLDTDGDMDAFIGNGEGTILYFENIGNAMQPNFVERIVTNPLALIDVGTASTPAFVDIDGDGDCDVFSGEYDGIFNFFQYIPPAFVFLPSIFK